jgi:hypothetical protein
LFIFDPDQSPLPASEKFKRAYKRAMPHTLKPGVAVNVNQGLDNPSKSK